MTADDILAGLGAQRKERPHRHRWFVTASASICSVPFCGAIKDPAKSRRGKNNRNRGNAYEREVAAKLGIQRTGQYGDKADVTGPWIIAQCKNGGAFPERIWKWLNELPHGTERLRAVVIGDAPGAGSKRRSVIVLDLDDFAEWYGGGDEDG